MARAPVLSQNTFFTSSLTEIIALSDEWRWTSRHRLPTADLPRRFHTSIGVLPRIFPRACHTVRHVWHGLRAGSHSYPAL